MQDCCKLSVVRPILSLAWANRHFTTFIPSVSSMRRRELHSALGCNVYVSEGRDKGLIDRLRVEAEATQGALLANVFVDEQYHRTGFTFVSDQPDRLTAAVVRLSRATLALLDLRRHGASHPRLGVVDHISLHPLGSLLAPPPLPPPLSPNRQQDSDSPKQACPAHQEQQQRHQHPPRQQGSGQQPGGGGSGPGTVWEPPPRGLAGMAVPASCAQDIAWCLSGVGDYGEEGAEQRSTPAGRGPGQVGEPYPHVCGIPVYLYGYAHSRRRPLSEVRRELGYFRSSPDGAWHGALSQGPGEQDFDLQRYPPDLGPPQASARSGLVTIGAVPWVVNYNVPLVGVGLHEAKLLARALSERGGGLPYVEAMALKHAKDSHASMEVACNLLDEAVTSPAAVQARLDALSYTWGLDPAAVLLGYRTNKSPEELLRTAVDSAERWMR